MTLQPEKKKCFVITPIGEPDSDTRKRSDQVLKHIIRPAVEGCGYEAERADEMDKPGMITSQVIQRVVSDPLVVADLTERNPNVFQELAIRHAIRKPLVQLIKKGERLPFDVAGTRTIQVDHHDLDSVEAAKKDIQNQIRSLEEDSSNLETPISVSLDLQMLRQSDNPEERSLADLLAAVSDLRASVAKVEGKLPAVEEVQGAFRTISTKLEDYFESPPSRRRSRFHPIMLHEMRRFAGRGSNRELGFLIVASMLRDEIPWVYEAGMEAYRASKSGNQKIASDARDEFLRLTEMTLQGPWMEFIGRNKEGFMLLNELQSFLHEFVPPDQEAKLIRRSVLRPSND